jgi:putative nucleotidyltransferase with HDIG domain
MHGENNLGDVLLILTGVMLLATGWRYHRRWRLGGDRVQLALVLASWLGVEAVLSLRFGTLWHLSWWVYHALLLAGFGSAVYAIVTEYRRVRVIDEALAGVRLHDDMEHITRGYPEALRALVAAVEAKDEHTHGHSARVAEYSVRLGRQMGLGATQLRELAQGAVLHDIGKIGTADDVLNKPGRLTPQERAWIEQHPVVGWEIVRQAPSLHAALSVVRHHHERWDGGGYPDGLAGDRIPLQARMAAVADVWDALTSERSYRPAWSAKRALDHIVAGAGSQFDPACVDAFLDVLALQGIAPTGEFASEETTAAAAGDCHAPADPSPTR